MDEREWCRSRRIRWAKLFRQVWQKSRSFVPAVRGPRESFRSSRTGLVLTRYSGTLDSSSPTGRLSARPVLRRSGVRRRLQGHRLHGASPHRGAPLLRARPLRVRLERRYARDPARPAREQRASGRPAPHVRRPRPFRGRRGRENPPRSPRPDSRRARRVREGPQAEALQEQILLRDIAGPPGARAPGRDLCPIGLTFSEFRLSFCAREARKWNISCIHSGCLCPAHGPGALFSPSMGRSRRRLLDRLDQRLHRIRSDGVRAAGAHRRRASGGSGRRRNRAPG